MRIGNQHLQGEHPPMKFYDGYDVAWGVFLCLVGAAVAWGIA